MRKYNFENKDQASRAGAKGSRKGVQNRSTKQVREAFQLLIENNLEQMQSDLNSMDAKDRVKLLLEMAKFVLPRLSAVSLEGLEEKPRPILLDTRIIDSSLETDSSNNIGGTE